MAWQTTPYTVPAALAALLAASLGLIVWRRRPVTPGSSEFAAFALAVTIWCLGDALELATADVAGKTFWTKLLYAGVVATPPLWLVCVARYSRADRWITRRRLMALAIVPTITLLLVVTNELHGLIWSSITVVNTGTFTMWRATYGNWFFVHFAYSYLALAAATLLIVRFLVRYPSPFSGQAVSMLFGMSAPWVANILYFLHLGPFPYLDLTPFGFAVGSIGVALGLTKFRLFELAPLARAALFEALPDATLVLDARDQIVDLNPAAQQLIGSTTRSIVGSPIGDLFSWWKSPGLSTANGIDEVTEVALGTGELRYFDLRLRSLRDVHKTHVGRLVLLQDATDRRRAEEERVRRIRQETTSELAETARRRAAFLGDASRRLAQSLELDRVLDVVGHLVVPELADGVAVAIKDDAGCDQGMAIKCARVADAELLRNWQGPGHAGPMDVAPIVLNDVTEHGLLALGCAADAVQMWQKLGPSSLAYVPVRASAHTLGSMWLFTSCSNRSLGSQDLELAIDLAGRVTVALTNVQLYRAARREIVERQRAEQAVARVAAQEQALADFQRLALGGASLDSLMAETTRLVGNVLGVDHVAMLTQAEDCGGTLRLAASFGWPAGVIHRLPSSLVVSGGQPHEGEPVLIENWDELESDGRCTRPALLRDYDVGSTAVVGIRLSRDQRPLGWLEVDTRLPNALDATAVAFLQRVTYALALAIERQHDQEVLRQYARAVVTIQENERRRLARELHDEVGQQLTGLHLLLGTVGDTSVPNRNGRLREAQSVVTELLGQVRDISIELRPAILDDLGLLATLQWLIERYATLTGITVQLEHSPAVNRFAPPIEIAAYRIVQEALTNVARHADVQAAIVRVSVREAQLEVEIEDAGRGFDVEQVDHRAEAIGLSGMRERAEAVGGSLSIMSQPGAGTRISAQFPI